MTPRPSVGTILTMILTLLVILTIALVTLAALSVVVLIVVSGPDGRIQQGSDIELHHAPEHVFEWLTDLGRVGRWSKQVKSYRPLEPMRPFEVGARYEVTMVVGASEVTVLMTVVELVAGRRIRTLQLSPLLEVETIYELTPTPAGGTRLSVKDKRRFRGLLKLFAASQQQVAQVRLDEDLAELRRQMDAAVALH